MLKRIHSIVFYAFITFLFILFLLFPVYTLLGSFLDEKDIGDMNVLKEFVEYEKNKLDVPRDLNIELYLVELIDDKEYVLGRTKWEADNSIIRVYFKKPTSRQIIKHETYHAHRAQFIKLPMSTIVYPIIIFREEVLARIYVITDIDLSFLF